MWQGKKLNSWEKQGLVPGVVYGKNLANPLMIAVDKVKMVQTYHKAGKSTAIELQGDNIDQLVLVHDIQLNPVTDHLIHIDFLAVNKDEKVRAEVPLVLVGQSLFEKQTWVHSRFWDIPYS
jgi:large subunit ribosomal protein L25